MPIWWLRLQRAEKRKLKRLRKLQKLAQDLVPLIEYGMRSIKVTEREATMYNDMIRLRGTILGYLAEQEEI